MRFLQHACLQTSRAYTRPERPALFSLYAIAKLLSTITNATLRKAIDAPAATSHLESSVPKRRQWPANFIENNKCEPHIQSNCLPNNLTEFIGAKSTMTTIEPFCLSCTKTSIQMQGLQSVVSPILYSNHIVCRYETFSAGSRKLTQLALLTKLNHCTVDRSYQLNASFLNKGRIYIMPMYHSTILKSRRKSLSPCSCLINPEDRLVL